MSQTSMKAGIAETRIYRYDVKLIDKYCADNPFYQNNSIIIPNTPKLITEYFHLRRRVGSEQSKAKFIDITDKLITDVKKFVPIIIDNKEEWVEQFDSA